MREVLDLGADRYWLWDTDYYTIAMFPTSMSVISYTARGTAACIHNNFEIRLI